MNNDPMIGKIIEMYGLHNEEEGTIAIEHFMKWWKGTDELGEMGLKRLSENDFGGKQEKLREVSQKLLDVHECGTSSLMFTYFLEFSAEWLETIGVKDSTENEDKK